MLAPHSDGFDLAQMQQTDEAQPMACKRPDPDVKQVRRAG
jgi:hypothetical protein